MLFSDLEDDDEPLDKQGSGDVGSDQSKIPNDSETSSLPKMAKMSSRKKSVMNYAIATDQENLKESPVKGA
jgi:hypothetical protein